jgi:RNA polymerase primary sigma factor
MVLAVYPWPGGEPARTGPHDGPAVGSSEGGWSILLSPERERRLVRAARTGDRRARVCLVEAHLPLVLSIARRYANRGVPFLDLVQEGSIGLMRAVEQFEPGGHGGFSAYASRCVRQAVRRAAVERGGLIRVPAATVEAIERLRRAAARLSPLLGREPTDGELALELGTTPGRVGRLVRLSRPPLLLQDLAGRPRVAGEWAEFPPDALVLAALRVDLHAMLATLTARERRVLHLRLGLVDGRRCSLDEVGRRLGLSPERTGQLERLALAKLRVAAAATSQAGRLG